MVHQGQKLKFWSTGDMVHQGHGPPGIWSTGCHIWTTGYNNLVHQGLGPLGATSMEEHKDNMRRKLNVGLNNLVEVNDPTEDNEQVQ